MSKISQSVPANFANVHWFRDNNIRVSDASWGNPTADLDYKVEVDEKTGLEKVVSKAKPADRPLVYLMRDGWLQSQGVVSGVKADSKMQAAAIADREAILKELEAKEETAGMAVMLRELWFPNGKAVKPEWIANNCYRRSRGLMGVLLRRKRDNPANWDRDYTVYLEPKEFGPGEAGALAKLVDHILENTLKTAGRKELQPADYFFQAVEMRRILGDKMKESDLIRLNIKRGEAQRAFALVTLDARFPELNIQARCKGNPPETYVYESRKSYLSVAALRHADLVRLVGNKNPENKEDKEYTRNQTRDMTEDYFRKAMAGGKVAAITSRQVIDAAKNSPCILMQYLAAKLTANDGGFAALFTDNYKRINKSLSFLADEDAAYAKLVAENDDKPADKAA